MQGVEGGGGLNSKASRWGHTTSPSIWRPGGGGHDDRYSECGNRLIHVTGEAEKELGCAGEITPGSWIQGTDHDSAGLIYIHERNRLFRIF